VVIQVVQLDTDSEHTSRRLALCVVYDVLDVIDIRIATTARQQLDCSQFGVSQSPLVECAYRDIPILDQIVTQGDDTLRRRFCAICDSFVVEPFVFGYLLLIPQFVNIRSYSTQPSILW
jgi:hypothetical protein